LDLNAITFELFVPGCVPVDVIHPINELDLYQFQRVEEKEMGQREGFKQDI
jgi:hypothetical protein